MEQLNDLIENLEKLNKDYNNLTKETIPASV